MTDAHLVRAVAERVMGWTYQKRPNEDKFQMWQFRRPDACAIYVSPNELAIGGWWPFAFITDALMLVGALSKRGMRLVLEQKPNGRWAASMVPNGPDENPFYAEVEPDVCRAITLACARAAGVEV